TAHINKTLYAGIFFEHSPQHVPGAFYICVYKSLFGTRLCQARQMEDIINPCHRLIQRFLLDTIAPHQPDIQVLKITYVRGVPYQAGDCKTFFYESIGEMTPDKTCCTGNKGFHTDVYCKEGLPIFSRKGPSDLYFKSLYRFDDNSAAFRDKLIGPA